MYNSSGNGYGTGRGGLRIPPIYIYVAVGIAAVLLLSLVGGLLSAGMQAYFALAVGVLLVLGNVRDLLPGSMANQGTALMNALLGAALILFFVGSAFGWIWYVPALALLVAALPLGLRRAAVYTAYLDAGRTMVDGVRRVVGSRTRVP
ncbi:MAG TPA: hypothetical protein VNL77_05375 [Roseiflexaceae bacterium]|nr:hypothetical protein [Roseiflexaceae bacterium]